MPGRARHQPSARADRGAIRDRPTPRERVVEREWHRRVVHAEEEMQLVPASGLQVSDFQLQVILAHAAPEPPWKVVEMLEHRSAAAPGENIDRSRAAGRGETMKPDCQRTRAIGRTVDRSRPRPPALGLGGRVARR
jgi:hypothetical protein